MSDEQAELVNKKLSPFIYSLLSEKGRGIYFPKEGIISQSADANGKRINATIGIATEDDGGPMKLFSVASRTLVEPGSAVSYAPSHGKPSLRAAWKESIREKNPSLEAETSVPVVTSALSHGLYVAGYLFVGRGDRIILPDLHWENYGLIFGKSFGGVMETYNTFSNGRLDIAALEKCLSRGKGKKVVLLNFPCNPSGYTPTKDEAMEIAAVIKSSAEAGNHIVVLIDDAYFGFFYEDETFKESMFSLLAGIHENVLAVKIDGATKEFYSWGLRVGFLTYASRGATGDDYRILEDKTAGAIRATVSSASHLSQSLVLAALQARDQDIEKNFAVLKRRYERVRSVIGTGKYSRYFTPLPFNSGYFMCLSLNGIDAEKVRQLLLRKYDTGVIAFGNILRIAFSSVPERSIEKLFSNIYAACREAGGIGSLMDEDSVAKLEALGSEKINGLIEHYARLCSPAKIKILSGSREDAEYVKELAIRNCEEIELETPGHTVHFDGYYDQGRDKEKTKVLLSSGSLIKSINTGPRDECLGEMTTLLDGIMAGKEMLVSFYCLGPKDSKFSLPAVQITDSAYVAHSENMLYRNGYDTFRNGVKEFFHFVHSAGELENGVSKNHEKKRIYIDLEEDRVFSVNTQYAGNSVGLKKLALRLAINKANGEDWLTEHMFLMGVQPEWGNRRTYFCGAFPSACGKTSTAMVPGQSIVGDDIVYMKRAADGKVHAVNIEQGIFGIIADVNSEDDPLIHKTLVTPRELIFSNVLVNNGRPYWLGMGESLPGEGLNYSGRWKAGKKDKGGAEILPAHKNARYTMRIEELENVNKNLHNPEGVPVSAIIYGGRDSDTSPPVYQSFSWDHGVFIGASLESETTAATIGQSGVRKHDPMAILDFLVVPIGKYLSNHLKFGRGLAPVVFSTNYFLKENGAYMNSKVDKKVWLYWMEGRVHGDYGAIETPVGMIPKYDDIAALFAKIFSKPYSKDDYEKQFSINIPRWLERLERIENVYIQEEGVPKEIFDQLDAQTKRLHETKRKFRKELISPFEFA